MEDERGSGGRRGRRVVIIGAGPGGLCTGIKLREAGYEDFVILEAADGVGGTWRHNTYPGAACDVASHLYSFSFELKRDWSRPYATQPEILEYFEHCGDAYGLEPHLRLRTPVRGAHWDDERLTWTVVTAAGERIEADVVVSAVGMFNGLNIPDIDGLDRFGGTLFHSARWRHDHDLAGEAVAVVGSAASAVQFVPEIAPQVCRLHVFQRSPQWVLPKADAPLTEEELEHLRTDPVAARQRREEIWRQLEGFITFADDDVLAAAEAAGRANLELVEDPDVRAALLPQVPFGCQRPLISNAWFPTFNQPHVELVTDSIVEVTADAVVTADGVERPVDTIILATGFDATRYASAIDITGADGRALADAWDEGPQAYLGITTSGFPNLFMTYGPNTNNGSILFMIECQVDYIVRQLRRMVDEQLVWIDVRGDVQDRYNAELQHDLDQVRVWQAGCSNYYRAPSGRIVTQWPHTMAEYRARTGRDDPEAYEVGSGAATAPTARRRP